MMNLSMDQGDRGIVFQNVSWASPVCLSWKTFECANPPSYELLNKRVRLVADANLGDFLPLT